MCGFVGYASSSHPVDLQWLAAASSLLIHRGPDDHGQWISEDHLVGLAHRRLSIRDLSLLARQPMQLRRFNLHIVFNGEIYNCDHLRTYLSRAGYSFETSSDTEVLLASYKHWGVSCLAHLNGMFSFAIYDQYRQEIFIARDRAGEKPLFYRFDGDALFFASELKALLSNRDAPKTIDPVALDCYLSEGYVPANACIIAGFKKLPPAHALKFKINESSINVWRYWEIPQSPASYETEDQDLLDELETLLENAVGQQLIADVPIGILLSGGVDSSLITAMASRYSDNVQTFSIGFSGHDSFDETSHAQLIANHFNTKHTVLQADLDIVDLLPRLSHQIDEPIIDSSMLPTYLVSKLVSGCCTVALGGDGGDELFGGYKHYQRLLALKRNANVLPAYLRHLISRSAQKILPIGFAGRSYFQAVDEDWSSGLPQIAYYFDAKARSKFMKQFSLYHTVAENIRKNRIPSVSDLAQRATRMDFCNYLPGDILVKIDRSSMLNSLEIRAPFLDKKIIEFAFSRVPSSLKATEKDRKILLKRLASKILPPSFDLARKRGFSIPLAHWLKSGPFRDLFWDTLTSPDCMFDAHAVRSLLLSQDRGYNNSERLFGLVHFELWRKAYGATM